jgi:hypothetical protein
MKKLATLVFSFLLLGITAKATTNTSEVCEGHTVINRYDGNTYIFVENSVEFSVFADGQFDFAYVGPNYGSQVQISTPNVNVSFNSGHNYEMFVQYDDYGAVIQIENVPVYYDEYGRITQAGEVDIRYNNRRIVRVGGLYVHYNNYGHYVSYTGFINTYNQFYVYQPWHMYYMRPIYTSCIVYDYPYRRYYSPYRYSYNHHINYYNNRHRRAYVNGRRSFHRPGSRVHHRDGRIVQNRDFKPTRRNTMVAEHGRRDSQNERARTVTEDRRANTRGALNNRERSSNITDRKPSNSRAAADSQERRSDITDRRSITSRRTTESNRVTTVKRDKPMTNHRTMKTERSGSSNVSTINRRSEQSRKTVSTTNGNRETNRTSTKRSSTNRIAKGSTSSRSNTSGTRKTTGKRGRGL